MRNPRQISDYVSGGEVAAAILSKSGKISTGVCIDKEIKAIFKGKNARKILEEKAEALKNQQKEIDVQLPIE